MDFSSYKVMIASAVLASIYVINIIVCAIKHGSTFKQAVDSLKFSDIMLAIATGYFGSTIIINSLK